MRNDTIIVARLRNLGVNSAALEVLVSPRYTSGELHLSSEQHLKSHIVTVIPSFSHSVLLQAHSFTVLHKD